MLGKVQREAPQKTLLLASMAWLDSDLIAHFIQSAEISHLLFRQSRPKGKRQEDGGREKTGQRKIISIFKGPLLCVPDPYLCLTVSTHTPPALAPNSAS